MIHTRVTHSHIATPTLRQDRYMAIDSPSKRQDHQIETLKSNPMHGGMLSREACIEAAPSRIPFGDHPLNLERYRED